MARLPRLALAGHLHHLIHRGHNLQPIVVDDEDRKALLAALQDSAATHKVAIHAYVVMPTDYTFKQGTKTMAEYGTITYALDKTTAGWRIAAWSFSW